MDAPQDPDKNRTAVEIFNNLAVQYQDKYMDVGHYSESFAKFCAHIPVGQPRILDVACGPGNISRYLLDMRPDFQILGLDLAPNMVELAQANNPAAEFRVMDCRAIDQLDGPFEGIVLGFCLPYLNKEEAIELIATAAGLLGPTGVLYLSTMEDAYSKSKFESPSSNPGLKIFMHYHEAGYLTEAMKEAGFQHIDVQRQAIQGNDADTPQDLMIVARY